MSFPQLSEICHEKASMERSQYRQKTIPCFNILHCNNIHIVTYFHLNFYAPKPLLLSRPWNCLPLFFLEWNRIPRKYLNIFLFTRWLLSLHYILLSSIGGRFVGIKATYQLICKVGPVFIFWLCCIYLWITSSSLLSLL